MQLQSETHKNTSSAASVVVPSYNHKEYVGWCLRSIIKQTKQPSHLLVIDDGSTDDSPRLIESVLKDCPFPCELIARENRGLSATLNQSLELTSGDYFAYLSSDDVWLEDFLEARIARLRSRQAAVLAANCVDDDRSPEPASVLTDAPSFRLVTPLSRGYVENVNRQAGVPVFLRVKP